METLGRSEFKSKHKSSEIDNILKEIKDEEKVNIIAKSIGTLVCMKLLDNIKDRIDKIILCGICLNDLREEDFGAYEVLRSISRGKVVVFQNSNDPHGNYQQVFAFLDKINPRVRIIKKEAGTHDYPYYEEIKLFLK